MGYHKLTRRRYKRRSIYLHVDEWAELEDFAKELGFFSAADLSKYVALVFVRELRERREGPEMTFPYDVLELFFRGQFNGNQGDQKLDALIRSKKIKGLSKIDI